MKQRPGNFGLAAGLLMAAAACALAGDLNPPAGPVAPTPGPEPRIAINATNTPGDANSLLKITQPGSYYLTGDITGAAGLHGIEIGASDVTIDLMGFTVRGVPGSIDGIARDTATVDNIRIVNGVLRDWGDEGIDLATGVNHQFCDVQAHSNLGSGIICGENAVIESCTTTSNGNIGIFPLGPNAVVRACTANSNSGGIRTAISSVVTDSVAGGNSGIGIFAGNGSIVTNCCSRQNTLVGITVGIDCIVIACAASFNTSHGISTGSSSGVWNCTAADNSGDGINAGSDCLIKDNDCDNNGQALGDGAGIHILGGGDSRIEGNNCTDNDRGIDVDVSGNIIIRNTCASNTTNWDIVANNVVGPILDRTAPGSAAILGNSAPSSLGTTDANANFTY